MRLRQCVPLGDLKDMESMVAVISWVEFDIYPYELKYVS